MEDPKVKISTNSEVIEPLQKATPGDKGKFRKSLREEKLQTGKIDLGSITEKDLRITINRRTGIIIQGSNEIQIIPMSSSILPVKLNDLLRESELLRREINEAKEREHKNRDKKPRRNSKNSESYDETLEELKKHDSVVKEMLKHLEEFKKAAQDKQAEIKKRYEEARKRLNDAAKNLFSSISKLLFDPLKNAANQDNKKLIFGEHTSKPKEDEKSKSEKDFKIPFQKDKFKISENDDEIGSAVIEALKEALSIGHSKIADAAIKEEETGSYVASDKEKELLLKGSGGEQHQFRDLHSLENEVKENKRKKEEKVRAKEVLSR